MVSSGRVLGESPATCAADVSAAACRRQAQRPRSVGYTACHHLLRDAGQLVVGDYFKKEAIACPGPLTEVWKIPPSLLATVYHTDDEAYAIWRDHHLPPERIIRIGDNQGAPFASDNFWQMADTAPAAGYRDLLRPRRPYRRWPPARLTRTATASSRSGTRCSCSSTASPTAAWIRCRRRAWTPAWGWSGLPRCSGRAQQL